MSPSTMLRSLAASTAIAVAFGPLAYADGLIGDQQAVGTYRPAFSIALRKAVGDDAAGTRAGAFALGVEAVLRGEQVPKDIDMGVSVDEETGAKILVYPKKNSSNMLVIFATVPSPAPGLEKVVPAFKACFQKNGHVIGGAEVANSGGVKLWDPPRNPAGSADPPCNEAVYSAADEFAQIVKKSVASGKGEPKADPQASNPSAAAKSEAPSR